MPATFTRDAASPTAEMHEVRALMQAEGLSPHRWSNGPGDTYAAHSHTYHKVLYCLRGSIRFILTREEKTIEMREGDRLDLELHTEHAAVVGSEGVTCLEAPC